MKGMLRWWKDLSVSKKLTLVVGTLALLIVAELFTLYFVMDTLSAVRAFVGGEALWSKAQKNAVHSLHRFAATGARRHYEEFKRDLEIPAGDSRARLELEKPKPDLEIVTAGFLQGTLHPDDIPGVIRLLRRGQDVSYVKEAVSLWKAADERLNDLSQAAAELERFIARGEKSSPAVFQTLDRIDELNNELTDIETRFSDVLGQGSRAMERTLMVALILTVVTFAGLALFLAFSFSRGLARGLKELNSAAQEVGRGNFSQAVPVRSRDELGRLAEALNMMARALQRNIGRRQQAESANQIKTMFLASVSHEIRTPLGVILGFAELLKDPSISWTDHTNYVETIERTGRNLTRIINDVIDISKVESGHLEIEKSRFPLSELIDELRSMMSHRAEATGNRLIFLSQGEAGTVFTDRTRLRQVLTNLIGNALKFTDHGTVKVAYGVSGDELSFEVSDTGVGIAPEDAGDLFRVFSRVGAQNGSASEGSGLGLALAKRLANALGGDVTLKESRPGVGSVFLATVQTDPAVQLPAPRPVPVPPKPAVIASRDDASFGLKGKKILVVEDAPDNQFLIRAYLTKQDVSVDIANNGEEGVTKALSKPYDLVLMDMQMPVMDGYTATETLRRSGYRKPIVALTAHAMKEDRERCLRAGCDEYLTKPIESSLLYKTISRFVS